MTTIVRDDAPETTPTDRQVIALDLIHACHEGNLRADRATAHAIRAAIRAGLTWRTVEAGTHLTHGEAVECLNRWPGDQP